MSAASRVAPSYGVDGVGLDEGAEPPLGVEPDAGGALDDDELEACVELGGGVELDAGCAGGVEAGLDVAAVSAGAVDVMVLP